MLGGSNVPHKTCEFNIAPVSCTGKLAVSTLETWLL